MKDTIYRTVLLYTKLSPPLVMGVIPRIGRKKLLEKLAKYGVKEEDVDKSEEKADGKVTYAVWLERDILLEIIEV